jgi:hypothetical protein
VVAKGLADRDQGRPPTALAGLSVTVAPDRLGRGQSALVLRAMKAAAVGAGLSALVVPVRPTAKRAYPLTPMERYVRWTRPGGAPSTGGCAPTGGGAAVLAVCPASGVVEADVGTWEAWTRMAFPETGPYVIPEALVPVEIDRERDLGRYVEPNVWVRHPLGEPPRPA